MAILLLAQVQKTSAKLPIEQHLSVMVGKPEKAVLFSAKR
jgi:hypothetical protein